MQKIQIVDGKVHWIFTLEQLPEWNPEHIHVVDYPADGYQPVQGDLYEDGVFLPAPPIAPAPDSQEAISAQARAYLASTDWYVIRYQETSEPIPPDILIERQAARGRVVELEE